MATKNHKDGSQVMPLNNVTRAEMVAHMHYLQYEVGTITKAIDELNGGTGLIKQTDGTVGAKTAALVSSVEVGEGLVGLTTVTEIHEFLENYEEVTANPFALDLTKRNSLLRHTANAAGSIPVGTYVGQQKFVKLTGAGAGYSVELTGTFHGFTSVWFGDYAGGIGFTLELKWNGAAWEIMGGNAVPV